MPAQAFTYTSSRGLRRAIGIAAGGRLPPDDEDLADELAALWATVYRPIFDRSTARPLDPRRTRPGRVRGHLRGWPRSPHHRRGSAWETFALLGLPEQPDTRFELVFETTGLGTPRVPTVADAFWFSYFRPAGEGAPTGLTWHRDQDRPGVPEAVVPQVSLACVASPPRSVPD